MAKLQIDDNLLVTLVHSSNALYDRSHAHYKDAVLKDQAWTTIARTLNLPKVVCKSRWTILRQRYSRVKRQLAQASKSSNEIRRKPTWKLFDNLHFLDNHIVPRTAFSELKAIKSEPLSENSTASDASPEQENNNKKPLKSDLDKQPILPSKTTDYVNGFRFTNFSVPDTKFRLTAKAACPLTNGAPIAIPQSPISPALNTPPPSNAPSCCTGERETIDIKPDKNPETDNVCANNNSFMMKQGDASFGEFISFELSSFKNNFNKDTAKQKIVNIIYTYKNEVENLIE